MSKEPYETIGVAQGVPGDRAVNLDLDKAAKNPSIPTGTAEQDSSLGAEFTPGPWRVGRFDGNLSVWGPGATKIVVRLTTTDVKDVEANARLIAASPALYGALKALDEYYGASGKVWDDARAALSLVDKP